MALGSMTGRAAKPRASADNRRKLEEANLYEMAHSVPSNNRTADDRMGQSARASEA